MKDTMDQMEAYYIAKLTEKDREIESLKQSQCNCYNIPNEIPTE
jgi:hypothetical protein